MHKNWWIIIGVIAIAAVVGILMLNKAWNEDKMQAELDMKMDKYCIDNGGSVVNKSLDEGDIIKMCVFQDGSLCEEEGFYLNECSKGEENCISDEDCVKDSCCHSASCTLKENAPVCKGILCTQECVPGTLDCGQGSCKCIGNNCVAEMGENSQMANPASVYCEVQGGDSLIITNDDGSQYGVCRLENGTQCDEWEYYRGSC